MGFYLSPLVDVNEIDLSTTIGAVSTSVSVNVLRNTYKGPEFKKILISDDAELETFFGKVQKDIYCYQDMLSSKGFLKFGNMHYVTRVMPNDATFSNATLTGTVTGTISGGFEMSDLPSKDPNDFGEDVVIDDSSDVWMIGASRGAWGNNVRVAIMDYVAYTEILSGGNSTAATYPVLSSLDNPIESTTDFVVVVEEKGQDLAASYQVKEVFNVSTDELAINDEGRSKFVETVINSQSNVIKFNLSPDKTNVAWTTFTEDYVVFTTGSNGLAENLTDTEVIEGYELYSNPEEIDVNILIDSNKGLTTKRYLIEIAESRKDCMAILDCPYEIVVNNKGYEATQLKDWRRGLGNYTSENLNENTSYAALYGNWLEVYEQDQRKYRWIPASGYMAGIFAKTDDVADPWQAPAGLNRAILTGVRRLGWNPDEGKRNVLYPNGINPIVSFSGQGKVAWGQKTMLDKNSSFNRINVRRLFITIEKAIATASKYYLFEPNSAIVRHRLVNMIEPFLRDVKAREGVYDFQVVCDETNNTPERIDRNELWCDIKIKATRTSEFIVLNFISLKTGANFNEG